MSLLKKLAGETVLYGFSSILSRVLQYLLLTPYLTRIFKGDQTEQYGIHGIMYAFAGLLMVLFTYRMETTFFRFGSRDGALEKSFSTASISLLVTSVVFVALMWFYAEELATVLTRPGDARFVRYFAFILFFDTLTALPFARLRLENRPIYFAVIKTANILLTAGVILFFLEVCPRLIGHGFTGFASIYDARWNLDYVFIANLVASAVTFLFFVPRYLRLNWQFDVALWKKMLTYAGPLIIVGIAGVINQLLDRYLLKELLPGTPAENLQQVGIYNANVKLAVLMSLFTQAFNYAAEPFFFRNADRSDSKTIYGQVGQAFALVGSLVFLGLMLYIDIVQHILGKDYREGIAVVPLLLLAYLFLGLYYNFSIWYKLADRTSIGAYIAIVGAVITVSLNLWLIPRIGYLGSAWAALACYSFMALASYLLGQRYYPIDYPMGKMFLYIGAAVAAYGLSIFVTADFSVLARLAINTGILALYLLLLYLIERPLLRRYFSK